MAAAFRPRRRGGVVIATEHEFVLADDVRRADPDGGLRGERSGACGSTTAAATRPAGSGAGPWPTTSRPGRGELFRLDPDGAVERVLADVTISNGLAWTADGARAYYIDTPTGRIDVFDADGAAGLAGRRPFVQIDPADGPPDGLTLDAEGRVWVALWGGAAVRCYDPDGPLVEQVDAAGAQGDRVHVRRAGAGRAVHHDLRRATTTDAHPTAGAVFRHRPGVRGRARPPVRRLTPLSADLLNSRSELGMRLPTREAPRALELLYRLGVSESVEAR